MTDEPDAIAALANALGLQRHQFAIAAGSIRRAEEIAQGVAAGALTVDEARADLDMMRSSGKDV